MPLDQTEFVFPDEGADKDVKSKQETAADDKPEIQVIDDTPEADQGREPKEAPKDVTDDELSQYDEGVRKRIKRFQTGYHDERRAKESATRERDEALRYAAQVVEENRKLQGSLSVGQQAYIEQAKKSATLELDEAKRNYKAAYESGDADALTDAQDKLTAARIKLDRIANFRPATPLQDDKDDVKPRPQSEPQEQRQPELDPKAKAWAEANPWFGKDRAKTRMALAVHQTLVEDEHVNPATDEYYDKLNSRLKVAFGEPGESTSSGKENAKGERKAPVVAPVSRNTAPKTVVLTKSQVAIAQKLGVPVELYAKHVREQQMRDQENG